MEEQEKRIFQQNERRRRRVPRTEDKHAQFSSIPRARAGPKASFNPEIGINNTIVRLT